MQADSLPAELLGKPRNLKDMLNFSWKSVEKEKKKNPKDLPRLWIPFLLATAVILRRAGWTLSEKPLSQGVSKHLITNAAVFGWMRPVRRNF